MNSVISNRDKTRGLYLAAGIGAVLALLTNLADIFIGMGNIHPFFI